MYKSVLIVILFCSAYKMSAQPQLTSSILPVIGDTIYLAVDTVLQAPGISGPNVTWNFSGLPRHYISSRIFVSPASTDYASLFPNATLARKDGLGYFYAYWKNTSTTSTYYGYVQPGIVDQNYNSMPINYYKFPIKYNDTFSSNFTATTNPGSIVGSGKYSFKADAWGTLKLPAKTVSNTMRTKSVLYIGDSSINSYSLTTEYAWYQNGHKEPLLVISSVVVNHVLAQKIVLFDDLITAGIKAVDVTKDIKIYPNPARNSILLSLDQSVFSGTGVIKVFNATGELKLNRDFTSDSNQYEIDLTTYASGSYFIEIVLNNKVLHQKFMKE